MVTKYLKFYCKILGNKVWWEHPFQRKSLWKEESSMNNADLVWRLVELLMQKEKYLNQVALDQAKKNNKLNDHKQDGA